MNKASSEALQAQNKSNRLSSEYRTKLNPKKKTKDTQNYKPGINSYKMNENLSGLNILFDQSAPDIVQNNKSVSGKSQKAIEKIDDGRFSELSNLADHVNSAGHVNSLISSDKKVCEQILNERFDTLPSKMWWVSPLKAPSNYIPPSITMSSKSYSKVSTVARPRVIRSAEDLRKKVISQCNLLEAVGYDKLHRYSEKLEGETIPAIELVASNEHCWVPSISIPSTHQTQSKETIATEIGNSTKSLSQTQDMQNSFDVPILQADLGTIVPSRIAREPETDTKKSSSRGKIMFVKGAHHSSSKKLFSNKSSQYEKVDSSDMNLSFTMGDIARKHIVNPLTSKLARLCTKQGQLYLDVINDLEKSCEEFEKACKHGVMKK